MKKPLIVANWKCNPTTIQKAKHLFNSIKKGIKNIRNTEVVICPPFIYLSGFSFQTPNLNLGSQNCYLEERGAFTGEISPLMLKDLGCKYVIIGHSERRKYFSETDIIINKKLKLVLKQGLRPILCIDKISQIKKDIKGILKKELKNIILAYEPIWAIGTGKACSFEQARKFNLSVKKVLGKKHSVLYGGSVNSGNALGFIQEAEFQGLLIGGASLNPKEFIKIVKRVSENT